MNAMAVPGAAALSSMAGGAAAACTAPKRNALPGTARSPLPKNPYAKRKQRKSAAAAIAAAESGASAVADECKHRMGGVDGAARGTGKLLVASIVSGFADVRSSLGITYDEAIGNAKEATASSSDSFSFDLPTVDASALTDFLSSNPLAVAAGGAVLLLPVIVSALFKTEGYGRVSAIDAYKKLGDAEVDGELLDIRAWGDIKSEGSPNLKAYRKKASQLPYSGEPDAYLEKALKKYRNASNTTIFVLDRFDGNSSAVAKLLAKGGFKAAYAIKDGAEGPRGWQSSDLPWLLPSKGFSIDLGGIKDLISTDTGSIVPTTLGVAAAAGVGAVVFSEAETALQLVGSAFLVQLFFKKLLFAKDRKNTLQELRVFLDTKVAPREIADELKGVASALVPKFEEVKAKTVSGATTVENAVATAVTETSTSIEAETSSSTTTDETGPVESPVAETPPPVESPVSETSAAVDSPVTETSAPVETPSTTAEAPAAVETPTSAAETPAYAETKDAKDEMVNPASSVSNELPRPIKPLSPYGQYPGLKPPASPSPSRP